MPFLALYGFKYMYFKMAAMVFILDIGLKQFLAILGEMARGGSRISGKGDHMYKGVWEGVRFADFISSFLIIL